MNLSFSEEDLKFQDYFRFSKDALAYLFKDFSEVELYPIRGRVSSSFWSGFNSADGGLEIILSGLTAPSGPKAPLGLHLFRHLESSKTVIL